MQFHQITLMYQGLKGFFVVSAQNSKKVESMHLVIEHDDLLTNIYIPHLITLQNREIPPYFKKSANSTPVFSDRRTWRTSI